MEVRGARGVPVEARLQSGQGAVVDRGERLQQAVRDRRECAADVRDDVVDVGEVEDGLRDGEVLKYACGFEVELDVACWVRRWVRLDQRAVDAQVRGRGMDVDDLVGPARVHGLEEWREGGVAKVSTFDIGVERDARGSKRVESVHGFNDGVLGIWQWHDRVEREALGVDSRIRCGLLIDQTSKRDRRFSIARIHVCAGRG